MVLQPQSKRIRRQATPLFAAEKVERDEGDHASARAKVFTPESWTEKKRLPFTNFSPWNQSAA